MVNINSVLLVLGPVSRLHEAGVRAVACLARSGAKVHVMLPVYDPVVTIGDLVAAEDIGRLQQQVISGHGHYVEKVSVALNNAGLSASGDVVWARRPHEAILEAAQEHASDLIVNAGSVDSGKGGLIRHTNDRELLRGSHCGVYEVRGPAPENPAPVLAAVDLNRSDSIHKALNQLVLQHALALSQSTGGPLCLLTVVPPLESALPLLREFKESAELKAEVAGRFHAKAEQLCREVLGTGHEVMVREGAPAAVIAACAREMGAATVMGTLARRGLSGALLGNTVERMLAQSVCDVYCVKQVES